MPLNRGDPERFFFRNLPWNVLVFNFIVSSQRIGLYEQLFMQFSDKHTSKAFAAEPAEDSADIVPHLLSPEKETQQKEDGRSIIYYTFPEPTDEIGTVNDV
jgi:hypothetical protein